MICNCAHVLVDHADEGYCFLCECPAFVPLTRKELSDFKIALPSRAWQKPATENAPAPAQSLAALFADEEEENTEII